MSRKRGKKQKVAAEAVPEEVLAEGSGPLAEAAPANVAELAAAAEDVGIAGEEPAVEAAIEEVVAEAAPEEAVPDPVEAAAPEALEELTDEEAVEMGAVLPTSASTMDALQLKYLVESLVFAGDKPITIQRLRQLTRVSDVRRLEQALADLAEDYKERGIVLQQVSGGYQFRTRTQFSAWVQQLIAGRPVRLSRAQLETLAIVAYRQPITRPEIDEIRGVDSSATLKLLLDRSLIRILGKKEEVGRPMLYGTTKEFLDFFSLGDLRELPTLREYSELTDESRRVMSDELGIDPDAAPEEPIEDDLGEEPPETIDDLVASYTMEPAADQVATDAADGEASSAIAHEASTDDVAADEVMTSSSDDSLADDAVTAPGDDASATASTDELAVTASSDDAIAAEVSTDDSLADDAMTASSDDAIVEASTDDAIAAVAVASTDDAIESPGDDDVGEAIADIGEPLTVAAHVREPALSLDALASRRLSTDEDEPMDELDAAVAADEPDPDTTNESPTE